MFSKTRFEGIDEAELMSFFATIVNTIAYASIEKPWVESEERVGFDILWCPHQDVYSVSTAGFRGKLLVKMNSMGIL
jgi:hypothetical protein